MSEDDRKMVWHDIVINYPKLIHFFDMASPPKVKPGSEKALNKTTVFGLTAYHPHYCILLIDANDNGI